MVNEVNRIPMPPRTVERVAELIRTQQEIQRTIDAVLLTAREALDVPDGWVIQDVRVGFVPHGEDDD